MPYIRDAHDIDIRDIQSSDLAKNKPRQISRWRNQMGNRSVDLRDFAPRRQKREPIKTFMEQVRMEKPEPILETASEHERQDQPGPTSLESPRLVSHNEIGRDEFLQELEEIEKEHVRLQQTIGVPAPVGKIPESEYAPWTYLPDRQASLDNDETLAALSNFAPPSARAPRAGFQTSPYAFIPKPQKTAHSLPLRSQKKKRSVVQTLAGAGIVFALAIFGVGVWQRSQGLEEQVAPELLQAYAQMEQGKADLAALRFAQASSEFSFAEEKFSDAQDAADSVGGAFLAEAVAAAPIPNKARSGIRLIAAGKEFSRAGADLSHAAFLISSANQSAESASFSSVFSEAMREFSDAQAEIAQAQGDLALVRMEDIPDGYRAQFSDSLARLNDANSIFQSIGPLSDALTTFAGMQSEKTYLLLFQNPAEIRATGGFLGTYGILKLDQGQIKSVMADGTYDADGQLTANVVPPYPVEYISTGWSMHDANWFFDFPTSAQKVVWFYEKTGGETPDGVIAITPQLIEDLLNITGPIAMPAYNTTLTADNFEDVVQQQVEVNYDKTQNKPKQILADFIPVLFARVQGDLSAHAGDIAKIVMRELQQKDILLYSRDQNVQQVFDSQGWSGRITPPNARGAQDVQDFLGVVQTNLGGYKTDRVIRTTMQTQTAIASDGSIHRTVTITRTHQGGKTMFDWYNKPNIDYMRLYVPLGTKLIQASGFSPQPAFPSFDYKANNFSTDETVAATGLGAIKDPASRTDIFQENGMQVFGNWLILNPGQTETVQVEYVLPAAFIAPSSYTLSLFSQAGIAPVLGVSLDTSAAGKISSCSQGTYDAQSMTLQKTAFSADTQITCVVGR